MTTSAEIEIVKESTHETQKIIQELFEVTSMHQSSMKDLSEKSASVTLEEIKDTKEKLTRQIQHERKLTRRVESILEKQSTILKQDWRADGSEAADEIKELSVVVSNQSQSVRVLKSTFLSLELRIEQLEKTV
jgi:phage shock protein A